MNIQNHGRFPLSIREDAWAPALTPAFQEGGRGGGCGPSAGTPSRDCTHAVCLQSAGGPRRTTRWMRGRLNEAILIPGGRAPSPDPEILLPKKEEETETRGKLAAPHADDRSLAPSGTRGSTGRSGKTSRRTASMEALRTSFQQRFNDRHPRAKPIFRKTLKFAVMIESQAVTKKCTGRPRAPLAPLQCQRPPSLEHRRKSWMLTVVPAAELTQIPTVYVHTRVCVRACVCV